MPTSPSTPRRMPLSYHPRIPVAASAIGLVLLVIGFLTPHATGRNTGVAMELGGAVGVAIAYYAKYFMLKHCREIASGVRLQNSLTIMLLVVLVGQSISTHHLSYLLYYGMLLLPLIIVYPEQKAVWLEAERVRGLHRQSRTQAHG